MSANPIILVAEEDCNDVILLALAFKRAGSSATVHFVENGGEATDYLRGNGPYRNRAQFPFPNLFVVSLRLSGMSGLELLASVREQRFSQQVVVGVLSGIYYEPEVKKALALGAKFCIVKTHDFRELVEVARQLTEECAAGLIDTEINANTHDMSNQLGRAEHSSSLACGELVRTSALHTTRMAEAISWAMPSPPVCLDKTLSA